MNVMSSLARPQKSPPIGMKNSMIKQSYNPLLSSAAPVFAGVNIGSTSGCTSQIFNGDVKNRYK